MTETSTTTSGRPPGRMFVTRSRGAVSGFLLVLLGLWGALIPFVGPHFHYAYTPDTAWTWTWGRFWLEVLPGAAAVLGGLMLALTAHRAVGVLGGYLASAAGAWFVLGPVLGRLWNGPEGAAGAPVGDTTQRVVEQIGFFTGLGVVILFLAAHALGRFTVLGVRDVRAAERRRAARFEGNRVGGARLAGDRVDETRPVQRPVTASTGSSFDGGATQVDPGRR